MALPPTIPTSFVPYSASAGARTFRTDYSGAFRFFIIGVLGLSVLLAVGVFVYGRILVATESSKRSALEKAENDINTSDVENFVRLRNRLTSGGTLLNNHIAVSGFFSMLEKTMPTTARFSSLHVALDGTGKMKLFASGVAKNFNALAAVSSAFAADGRVKDAIFSGIVVSPKDNSVSFTLTAVLDPKLLAFNPIGPRDSSVATTTMRTATSTTP